MSLRELFDITALVVFAIIVFILIQAQALHRRKRLGKMKIREKIAYASAEMMYELRGRYKDWGFQSLDSLKSIAAYIDEKKKLYQSSELLRDYELIFKSGAFVGELQRMKKGYKWNFSGEEPYMTKGETVIFPFDKIRKHILNGEEDSVALYVFC